MANKTLVSKVTTKQDTGEPGSILDIGTTFENIIDSETGYTLKHFFKSYLDFAKGNNYIYSGTAKPDNPQVKIWINQSKRNYS